MKYIWIGGGLGNQIYQYALYKQLQSVYGEQQVKADTYYMRMSGIHNGYELHSALGLNLRNMPLIMLLNKYTHFAEVLYDKDFPPDKPEILDTCLSVYLRGFWQSLDYFSTETLEKVKKDIRFPIHKLSEANKEHLKRIEDSNSVSVHIRRGNYFKNEANYNYFGKFCDNDYHQKAITQISERTENPSFFVFSDDIAYCKQQLNFGDNKVIFVENNKGRKSFWDMYLMSQCQHNIIANSTFSWWGAFLNQKSDKIVIAPGVWFNNDTVQNRLPKEWVKIQNI